MTATHQPDPYLRSVGRYGTRGVPCDCPCHWWPEVRESQAAPCCRMRGLRFIPSEGTYMPWPEDEEQNQ